MAQRLRCCSSLLFISCSILLIESSGQHKPPGHAHIPHQAITSHAFGLAHGIQKCGYMVSSKAFRALARVPVRMAVGQGGPSGHVWIPWSGVQLHPLPVKPFHTTCCTPTGPFKW